ncbi:hypothetical protein CC53_gp107 [Rhizobium phage vB_RleS_L338C]|uniref:hypothetical protein n=1 Tax=Rhizobium phage vB_RleS_L338C TaxID=1414737 RepID=UPI0003D90FD9|nr:hypothetical protein CC53_gp107 [Rhizobium phage vB_RleS_L338C]AHC30524.1 hypothetical protein L338C_107 [Rhizobium phage vB_RleS_L338C]QNH72163.1 hypothetical protein P11VFA_043 [Rhizobium phage P11VFA]
MARNIRIDANKCYWFNTLNDALASENLVNLWPFGKTMLYGETVGFAAAGRWISVYRSESGRYERPIHYATLMEDTYPREAA